MDLYSGAAASRAARKLPLLVALSGAAALVYGSLWMRSFGLVFGSTASAVALLLAVLMSGLALGSALAARRPSVHPLRAYARVELALGVAALVTLPLLRLLPWAYGLFAALLLLPTTVLLGATVPLALAFLERAGRDVRSSFGRLFLATLLGGAAGVTLVGFVLLEALGVRGTLVAAAAASLFVGGLALRWSREIGPPSERGTAPPAEASTGPQPARLGPALAALCGGASLGVEVLWTRSLVLGIGSTVYAFHVILLATLLGIALGAVLYERWRASIERPTRALGLLFVVSALAILAGQWLIGLLPTVWLAVMGVLPVSFAAQQIASLLLCLLVLLPVTAALGLSFPLLLHLADARPGGAQRDSGRLYGWTAAGAVVAALATQLWLVPRLGLQPPYLVFAGLLLAGGAWALLVAGSRPRALRLAAVAAIAGLLVAGVPRWQPWDPVVMSSGVSRYGLGWHERLVPAHALGAWLRAERRLLFYREGSAAVVAVAEPRDGSGQPSLSINGMTEAGSGALDVVSRKLAAHVPLLLHTGPRRVLLIGWGAGASAASAALHRVESLECVEIERATWEAAPFFSALSGRLRDDPRFRIAFADGRNHLLRSRSRYDVIVSLPSDPGISGSPNSFTREFYDAALAALDEGGVFGQRFHYDGLDPADLKVAARTFLAAFPHASLWLVPPVEAADGTKSLGADLLLVGSREPQSLDWPRLERAFADGAIGADLRSTRVLDDAAAFAATWAMGRQELVAWAEDRSLFPAGTPLNTDDYPYLELLAPRRNVRRPADAARAAAAQYETLARSAGDVTRVLAGQPLLAAGGPIAAVFLDRLAERYATSAQPDRAIAVFSEAARLDPRDAVARSRAGELLLEGGRQPEAEARLREAVRLDPTRARAWEALAAIALDRRDYRRAEEAHRAWLRLEPASVPAWLRLGAALARQDKWEDAKDALDTARSIDPNAPVDAELLAYIERRARGITPPH